MESQLAGIDRYLQMAIDWAVTYAPKVILAVAIFYIGMRLIRKINDLFEKTLTNRKVDATIRPFFSSLVDLGLKLVLFLVVANIFGFETTSIVAVISALAFAVGLALQGSLGHFASGILLLILKPYRVGEEIKVGDVQGVVDEIQVFNTIIRTPDNRRVIIPNGVITSGNITNISGQGDLRVDLTYTVAEANNIDHVRNILKGVAEACPYILKDRPLSIVVSELTPDEMKFLIQMWCDSDKYLVTQYYMNEHVKKAFESIGIEDHIEKIHVVQVDK
jgi:small conductance mechanosensitive channel